VRLATIRTREGTRAVRLHGDVLLDLDASDVGEVLAQPEWRDLGTTTGRAICDLADADFAPLVTSPSKVLCVGHNYQNHIREMGRELPTHPTIFPKFADTLIGANDDIVKPPESEAVDWEVELVVVIGERVRRANATEAEAAIAGFTAMNDVSMRDWQFRTPEWTQGKIWGRSTPVGPFLVTADEVGGSRPALRVQTVVDGVVMQSDDTGTLLFDPVALVQYASTIIDLRPGDLIATGTPAGVGHARTPPRYLTGGETVVASVEGIGSCTNLVVTR
jgi:acylpyruvate hydrolase